MSVQSRATWNPICIYTEVSRGENRSLDSNAPVIGLWSNEIQPRLRFRLWISEYIKVSFGSYVTVLTYTPTHISSATTVLTDQVWKLTRLCTYISHVKLHEIIRTHIADFSVKHNLGLELFLPRIFFCSSLARFSCSFLILCLSSSISRCSSTIANLSSAWD